MNDIIPQAFMDMVSEDIEAITYEIEHGTKESRCKLHRKLDGRYQVCVERWYGGLWGSNSAGTCLYYNYISENDMTENLEMMKAKLEAFQYQVNAKSVPNLPSTQVNVTTNVNVNITFEQAKEKIEDMTALSQTETDEILAKIDEIELISKENSSRKKKWEKVKPIISFALDKGVDVAITILGLVLQMKLGM